MEDLKKIQEFFSKPINEVGEASAQPYEYKLDAETYYKVEYTFTTDSGLDYIVKFDLDDDMADVVFLTKQSLDNNLAGAFPNLYIARPGGKNVFLQTFNKGELFKVMATITNIVKEFLEKYTDIKTLVISPSKEDDTDNRRAKLYSAFIKNNIDPDMYSFEESGKEIKITRNPVNENQNDPIDSIKMDVPLFLRSLEYAREDAKDDMDLHDFTEKAIQGTKQKGTLSMADYDDLTRQKIKEIIQQVISEKKTKRDRCLRIADRKFDKPSAYKSGAVVRCRKGDIWKDLKEEQMSPQEIISKIKTYRIPYKEFNQKMKTDWIPMWKEEYGNDIAHINELVARHLLYQISEDLFGGVEEIEFANKSKNPTNHFQMNMYLGDIILWTSPFIYVDNNHKAIARRSEIKVLNNDYDDIGVLKEDESLHKWFKRSGTPGKEGGWVDCNAPIRKDGKITGYKSCGRKEGEKRSKYPSCRPTPAKCKDKGKGKTWGKTK